VGSWHGYDVRQYQQALLDAFKPFEHYVPARPAPPARQPARNQAIGLLF